MRGAKGRRRVLRRHAQLTAHHRTSAIRRPPCLQPAPSKRREPRLAQASGLAASRRPHRLPLALDLLLLAPFEFAIGCVGGAITKG
jgi:hypothetical protein